VVPCLQGANGPAPALEITTTLATSADYGVAPVAPEMVQGICLDIQRARRSSSAARRLFDMRHIPLHPRIYLRSKRILYRNEGRIIW
jgi:hypothetical protein